MSIKPFIKYIILIIAVLLFARFVLFRSNVNTIPVRKVKVQNRLVERTVSASGEVKSRNQLDLTFGTAGRITYLGVEESDYVEENKLLAQLYNSSTIESIQAAKDGRDVAQRDLDLYIENYESNLQAAGGKDEYEISVRRLRELLSKAEATYQSTRATLADTYIYAPFSGTVIEVLYNENETVAATTAVLKLADLEDLIFEISLDQEDFGYVKENQRVNIELDAYENSTAEGLIVKLPKYANGGDSAVFTVKVQINESKEDIVLGMTGDAYIVVLSSDKEVSSVLYDEIFFDDEDKPYVWVVRDDIIHKQPVEIGIEGDIYTELKSTVEGQIVVPTNDDAEIREGSKAKVINGD